jgi:hypothetical protein
MAVDLTRGPVAAHLRRQGIPFALGLVAIFSFEAVDLFFYRPATVSMPLPGSVSPCGWNPWR